jgi:hypothetical protein
MATQSRRAQTQPSERAPRRAPRAAPNLLPVFATLGVVIVAALVVTLITKEDKAATQAAGDAAKATAGTGTNPFADIDTDPDQFKRASSGSSRPATTNDAPPGLADAQVFADARKLAAEAMQLVEEALAAEKAGDTETWRTKSIAARDKFDQVLWDTSDWETGLITTYGSNDAQVKKIGAEIDVWRKKMNSVRKVH